MILRKLDLISGTLGNILGMVRHIDWQYDSWNNFFSRDIELKKNPFFAQNL